MSTAIVIRGLQAGCAIGLCCIAAGFAAITLGESWALTVKALLGAGFALSLVTSIALARICCPSCRQPFCGSQSAGDEAPHPKLWTRHCRYCGQRPD